MDAMTGRERVAHALNHEEPDRVPLDVGGTWVSSLVVEAYDALMRHLGGSPSPDLLNPIRRVVRLDEPTCARLGTDTRPIVLSARLRDTRGSQLGPQIPADAETLVDELGITWHKVFFDGGFYWEQSTYPLVDASIEDLDAYPWPDLRDPRRFAGLEEEARRLFYETPYAIVGDCRYKNFWEPATWLLGYERALLALLTEQDFMRALFEKLYALNEAAATGFLNIAGPYLTAIRCSDDLGTQESLMMSPDTYRTVIKPFHKRFYSHIKRYTDAKIILHTDGNIVALLDDLIDAGVEVLNPVQTSAIADLEGLKAVFGDRLSFWGGIDTHHVLPHGTPDEVREEVRIRIGQFAEGGGFVAAPVHNIQADVKPENVLAMCDAVRELGAYAIR